LEVYTLHSPLDAIKRKVSESFGEPSTPIIKTSTFQTNLV